MKIQSFEQLLNLGDMDKIQQELFALGYEDVSTSEKYRKTNLVDLLDATTYESKSHDFAHNSIDGYIANYDGTEFLLVEEATLVRKKFMFTSRIDVYCLPKK